jgi:hypothetical protein
MSASAVSSICMVVMAGRQPVGERAAGGGHVRKQLRCLLQGDGRQHRPRRSARAQGDLWILAAALTGLDEARAHARATPGPDGRFGGATAADAQPAQLGRAAAAMASAAAMKAMGSHGVSLDGGGDSRRDERRGLAVGRVVALLRERRALSRRGAVEPSTGQPLGRRAHDLRDREHPDGAGCCAAMASGTCSSGDSSSTTTARERWRSSPGWATSSSRGAGEALPDRRVSRHVPPARW